MWQHHKTSMYQSKIIDTFHTYQQAAAVGEEKVGVWEELEWYATKVNLPIWQASTRTTQDTSKGKQG